MNKLLKFFTAAFILGISCKGPEITGGNIHLQEGRPDRAIEQYKKSIEKEPNNTTPVVGVSVASYMKKAYKDAVLYLEKAIDMDKEKTEKDLRDYEKLLNTKYLKWQIYYNGAVENYNENPNKGIELAKKSLDVSDPEKVSLSYCLLGRMVLNMGKVDEAEKYYEEAIKVYKNNVEPYIYLGRYYLTTKETEKALKYFNEALKVDSTKVEVYELIGQAYLLKKDYKGAIKSLEGALKVIGEKPTIFYNLMVAHYESENYDEGIKNGKKVIEKGGVDPTVLNNTYNLIGQMYIKKNEYKEAINLMKECIDKGINDCNAYSLMAQAYYKLGQIKESSLWSKKWEECEKNK
ncbi:MAG: tetratricopeptide repeat protein [candidate division WOR-3 bacterium]